VAASIADQVSDPLAEDILAKLVDRPMIVSTDSAMDRSQWKVISGMFTSKGRMFVSAIDCPPRIVQSVFHHNPRFCHLGALKNTDLVSSKFYWPVMDLHVWNYISVSGLLHHINAPSQGRYGINIHLGTQSWPLGGVTMDCVTDFLQSTALG